MPHVGGDADDDAFIGPEEESLANRLLAGPGLPGQRLAHDHGRGIGGIGGR